MKRSVEFWAVTCDQTFSTTCVFQPAKSWSTNSVKHMQKSEEMLCVDWDLRSHRTHFCFILGQTDIFRHHKTFSLKTGLKFILLDGSMCLKKAACVMVGCEDACVESDGVCFLSTSSASFSVDVHVFAYFWPNCLNFWCSLCCYRWIPAVLMVCFSCFCMSWSFPHGSFVFAHVGDEWWRRQSAEEHHRCCFNSLTCDTSTHWEKFTQIWICHVILTLMCI